MPAAPVKIPGYEFLHQLGSGGMSTVWLAVQESLQRKIAIKVMKRAHEASSDDVRQFEKRFLLEGRTMAKLPHRNIVAVYDIVSTDEVSYIAMEYLEGGTLSERMHDGLALADAISVVVQIGGALDYAHNQGIIHRDLKPANIMFRDAATPVLTDFGIARQQDAQATRLTQTGMLVGTPNYMSPEQISGGELDGRSDLYSLGIMFYELLNGNTPFNGDTPIAVMMAHLTQPVPPLEGEFGHFQPILDRMLAKNRDDRYANLREFVTSLKERVVGSDTLLTRLKIDPSITASEQLRQLGFSASGQTGRVSRNLSALSNSQPLPRPQQGVRKSGAAPVPPAARPAASRKEPARRAPPPGPQRPRWPWIALASVGVLLLVAIGLWRWQGAGGLSAESRELVSLQVKEAQRLAEQHKLVSPSGDNAYELLQKVLQKDAENAEALALLERIATALREDAEAAFAKGDLQAAQDKAEQGLFVRRDDGPLLELKARIDSAKEAIQRGKQLEQLLAGADAALKQQRNFGPDGVYALLQRAHELVPQDAAVAKRLSAFIDAQLAPARAALQANDAARAQDLLAALKADLGKETVYVQLVTQVDSTRKQSDLARQIAQLLQRGRDQIAAGRLAEPTAENAYETLDQLRQLAADDSGTRAFAAELTLALVADGRKALANAPQRALERAELALRVQPDRAEASALKSEVEQRLGQRLADIARALSAAKQALVEQRFLAPSENNARAALDAVLRLDPDNTEARQLTADLPKRIVESATQRAAQGDTATAISLVRAARDAYPQEASLTALATRLDAQAGAEQKTLQARSARERIAAAIAVTPANPNQLRAAGKDIESLLTTDPRDVEAAALRKRLADTLDAALRGSTDVVAFDAYFATAKDLDALLRNEPGQAGLQRDAAGLRQKLIDAEQARLAAMQGELLLNAQPWAKIESVLDGNRKSIPLPAESSTPLALTLPAGSYVITFRHPQANKPVTVIAKVEAKTRAVANAAFPTITAEDYFSRAGW
ncbi:MAG: protein kinase [Tahibacter sp.]